MPARANELNRGMTKCLVLAIVWAAIGIGQPAQTIDRQATTLLDQALGDKNPETRKQAVIALSLATAREPFLSRLEAMLNDKDVQVRLAAIASLEDLKSKRTVAALRRTLADRVPEVSFAAAKALFELHDPAGNEALLEVLSGNRKTASFFISKDLREAIRIMHTPKEMFMFALRQGVGFAPVPGLGEGVASMQDLLSDSGVSGRATAALLLGRSHSKSTLDALRDALQDRNWSVRAAAIHSLVLWDRPALEPDVSPLLNDDNEAVRLRAAAGCLRLDAIRHR